MRPRQLKFHRPFDSLDAEEAHHDDSYKPSLRHQR